MNRRSVLKGFAIAVALLFAPPLRAQFPSAVPRTTKELYEAMCRALPVGEETFVKWSVTGEEYVEYAVGVNLQQVSESDAEAHACRYLWNTFQAQIARCGKASLYFRIRPEFVIHSDLETGERKARIYSRYLISSKPALGFA